MSDIKKEIAKINQKKYLYPPKWEQIQEYVDELGVGYHEFERFFGVFHHCLTQVKRGVKQLPCTAWHFVYEKIKPTYGVGFVDDYNKAILKKQKAKSKKFKPVNHSLNSINQDLHDRIGTLK